MKWFYIIITQLMVLFLWFIPLILYSYSGKWDAIGILYIPIVVITGFWMNFVRDEWRNLK